MPTIHRCITNITAIKNTTDPDFPSRQLQIVSECGDIVTTSNLEMWIGILIIPCAVLFLFGFLYCMRRFDPMGDLNPVNRRRPTEPVQSAHGITGKHEGFRDEEAGLMADAEKLGSEEVSTSEYDLVEIEVGSSKEMS
ncbi:hypothetical protein OHC33_003129 [Knufia fluminis]|uniref:Uncharacterized protein n=1 Tax=Knufia fluminis TaxID=191047 RepID=A0AAN8IAE7_9EURO|nr:hypothetical protein OHC33_003129 [Knufia fluminis]